MLTFVEICSTHEGNTFHHHKSKSLILLFLPLRSLALSSSIPFLSPPLSAIAPSLDGDTAQHAPLVFCAYILTAGLCKPPHVDGDLPHICEGLYQDPDWFPGQTLGKGQHCGQGVSQQTQRASRPEPCLHGTALGFAKGSLKAMWVARGRVSEWVSDKKWRDGTLGWMDGSSGGRRIFKHPSLSPP